MTDYKKMIEEHSCKPNQGCGVMTICMCGVAEDMANEIERLREALRDVVEWADDLQIYAEPEHHMHPVFYNARSALEEKE